MQGVRDAASGNPGGPSKDMASKGAAGKGKGAPSKGVLSKGAAGKGKGEVKGGKVGPARGSEANELPGEVTITRKTPDEAWGLFTSQGTLRVTDVIGNAARCGADIFLNCNVVTVNKVTVSTLGDIKRLADGQREITLGFAAGGSEDHAAALERCNAERDRLQASLKAAGEAAARSRERHSADIAGHRRELQGVAAELAEALGREAAEREGRREAERRLERAERALREQHARAAVVERTVEHLRGQLHAARRELHDTAARDLEQADQSFREGLAMTVDFFDLLREARSTVPPREGTAGLPPSQAPVLPCASPSPQAVEPYDPAAGHPESCTFLVLECISFRIAAWVPRWWSPVCRATAVSTWHVHYCWGRAALSTWHNATHDPNGIRGQGRIARLFESMMQEVDALEASARNTHATGYVLQWFLHRVRVLKWLYEQMNQELQLDFDRMLHLFDATVHTSLRMWRVLDSF